MRWEGGPDIRLFRNNTAAFVHDLPAGAISDVAGNSSHIRVQVLTPVGALNREKQLGVVKELTEIVTVATGDPTMSERTWVLIVESPDGGWGIAGQPNTSVDLAQLAPPPLTAQY